MRIWQKEGLPIQSWCNNPEEGALEQAYHLANLPFAHHHIALMPDTHEGYGMPIGGVLAAKGRIVPNAVGVDIGCGMLAVQTTLQHAERGELTKIMQKIRETIPLGFKHNDYRTPIEEPPAMAAIAKAEYANAQYQVGTLGGGNHFIEIQKGSDGYLWFMVHSGSRNLGKKVCDHYNAAAKRMPTDIPQDWGLASFETQTEEGQAYLAEMAYCQRFALANRQRMADNIYAAFQAVFEGCEKRREINIHHNYAQLETHFGQEVWVHRKGATSAREGEIGIIPGSQGTKSYIVVGKGNAESFCSCSHGAGRRMGRKQAQRTLSLAEEMKRMDAQGIIHGIRHTSDLDEAAGAYKDIDTVMAEQADLVRIEVALHPLAVIKG